jgi:hypothetical protein
MSTTPIYSQEIINIGSNPNDKTGDPLRIAFEKINNNFTNLYQTFTNTTIAYTFGNTQSQVIFETSANTFSQGQFWIKSIANGTADTQAIELFAHIDNSNSSVKFTAYGTTFIGNPLTRYDMTVANTGNVQILINPLVNTDMTHLINSQVMWIGLDQQTPGIALDGYDNSLLATENPTTLRS